MGLIKRAQGIYFMLHSKAIDIAKMDEKTYWRLIMLDTFMAIMKKDPFSLYKKIEESAEYILTLEKLCEDKHIDIDEDALQKIKIRYFDELQEGKRRFLMQFAGEIIRGEG